MSSRATPAIVLGPTGNLQRTYKFFNLKTGKKIKRRQFTLYPMPDSVIAKVESFARQGVVPGAFDFTDRSGILFEWNDEIDESPEGLVAEDVVLYPSIVAEFPGVTLDRDIAVAMVEDDVPAKALLIDVDNKSQDGSDAYDDVSTNDEDTDNDKEEDDNDLGNDDDDVDGGDGTREADDAAAIAAGLRRSGRANKGRTERFANYTLLLHARKVAQGGPKRAMIRDGVMMFSADNVSDAKPIPVEDQLEYAFGVILQQYSMLDWLA